MDEAREHGLRSGISCPIHTARGEDAMFTCASDKDPEHTRFHIQHVTPDIFLFSAYLHEAVGRITTDGPLSPSSVKLTPREKQCLLWLADGKTQTEISDILSISERTVRFHLQNAMQKLGTVTHQQTVVRAVTRGLITPQFN